MNISSEQAGDRVMLNGNILKFSAFIIFLTLSALIPVMVSVWQVSGFGKGGQYEISSTTYQINGVQMNSIFWRQV